MMPVRPADASLLLIGRCQRLRSHRPAFPRWLRARSGYFFQFLLSLLINYCRPFIEDLIPDQGLASRLRDAADAEIE